MDRDDKPHIVCLGILDIKGDEIKHLTNEIGEMDANARIMDISLGSEATSDDIPLSNVLAAAHVLK